MSLFLVSLAIFLGIVLTIAYSHKGVLLNLLLLTLVTLGNRGEYISEKELIFVTLFSLSIIGISLFLTRLKEKSLGSFSLSEVLLGGSIFSLLVGMVLRPATVAGALRTLYGLSLVRRLAALGLKALLLTFGGWFSRVILVTGLNIWFLIKHL